MLRCLCLHRTRILVGDVGRLRLKATRAPTPAATTTAAPSTSPLAALAVLGARSPISSTTTATPTTAAATFLALRTGSRRRGGRSLRRHHVPARPEVGIYFDDADLRDLGNPACAGTAGATARAAPETRAAHRNTAGCRRRRAVGRRRRGRRRHRNVVLFLYIGRRSGRDRTRSLRLFLGRRSSFVPIRPTGCLINPNASPKNPDFAAADAAGASGSSVCTGSSVVCGGSAAAGNSSRSRAPRPRPRPTRPARPRGFSLASLLAESAGWAAAHWTWGMRELSYWPLSSRVSVMRPRRAASITNLLNRENPASFSSK